MIRSFRTPMGLVGLGLLVLVLIFAVLGPLLWGDQARAVDIDRALQGTSAAHWIGTDQLGRDLFARVLTATRVSLLLALLATVISTVGGLGLGAAPMFLGRFLGRQVNALINIAVAFPSLLLTLVLATIFGVGARGAVLAVGIAGIPTFARLFQTLSASVGDLDYVAAARIAGAGRLRILFRHVLPNVAEPLIVSITIGAGASLLTFAGLSFLGLGIQAPSYDWGKLMQDNLSRIYTDPLSALVPGLAVVITGLAFNLTGEAAARAFGIADPTLVAKAATGARDRGEPVLTTDSDHVEETSVAEAVLEVRNLSVAFPSAGGDVRPVRGVSLTVSDGEAVGIVGESGSGKSLTALSVAQLVLEPAQVAADRLRLGGVNLLDGGDHREFLGTSLAMVFQDPMTSFNPAHRIGSQLAEVGRFHLGQSRQAAWARAVDRLRAVRIREPERRARQYPFEFSGGMRQRAMIGMGLMGSPKLIIADEPTTALDVTVQQEVLALLENVRADESAALLLISHDVSVIREVCDRVVVMYAGRVVEELPIEQIDEARHPYTRALIAAVPDMESDLDAPLTAIPGQPVDPAQVPVGCAFAARCPLADDTCTTNEPTLRASVEGESAGRVACWHPIGTPSTALTFEESSR